MAGEPPSFRKIETEILRELNKEKAMKDLQKYNKFWVAAAGALLTLFISMYPDTDISMYANMTLAILTALGVYVIPNKAIK